MKLRAALSCRMLLFFRGAEKIFFMAAYTQISSKLLQTPEIQSRLKRIKLLLLDVDGVMTDGRIFWLEGHG